MRAGHFHANSSPFLFPSCFFLFSISPSNLISNGGRELSPPLSLCLSPVVFCFFFSQRELSVASFGCLGVLVAVFSAVRCCIGGRCFVHESVVAAKSQVG